MPELDERSQWLNLPMKRSGSRATRAVKRRGWRVNLPTSVVVTLIGIALTAWLFPAFTRQWDDRQKVAELKASLVADMAFTTGRALAEAQSADAVSRARPAVSASVSRPRVVPESAKQWLAASLQIRGRLLAYFGQTAVDRWELITKFVTDAMSAAYRGPIFPILEAKTSTRLAMESTQLANAYQAWGLSEDGRFDHFERTLLAEEDRLATSMRAMHVVGYSTRWRDVVSDLMPF